MLGHAFLDAAFIGTNWEVSSGQGSWWLAQAPGPNINSKPDVKAIQPIDNRIQASTNYWETNWDDYWKPLSQSTGGSPTGAASTTTSSGTSYSSSSSSSSSGGISIGAAAGLGFGIGIDGSCVLENLVAWLAKAL